MMHAAQQKQHNPPFCFCCTAASWITNSPLDTEVWSQFVKFPSKAHDVNADSNISGQWKILYWFLFVLWDNWIHKKNWKVT